MTVGVLALQGDFREHKELLNNLGIKAKEVRLPKDIQDIDRLIIPGGESTTIGKLMNMYNLIQPIREQVTKGMPLWGTCAGAILMAKRIADGHQGQPSLAVMDITVRRNAFGRQLDSFETTLLVKKISPKPLPMIFIRAPILESLGKDVKILAKLPDGKIIAAKQNNLLATSFHPELTKDTAFHKYFITL